MNNLNNNYIIIKLLNVIMVNIITLRNSEITEENVPHKNRDDDIPISVFHSITSFSSSAIISV